MRQASDRGSRASPNLLQLHVNTFKRLKWPPCEGQNASPSQAEGRRDATKSRTSFVRRWIHSQAELRCAVRIGAPGPFRVAAAVLLTETHCIHKRGICDLSCKQHAQQNRFSGRPVSLPTHRNPAESSPIFRDWNGHAKTTRRHFNPERV